MNASFRAHEQGHLKGDNATHPIEPRWRLLAALLPLALTSPQRRQPCRPQSSQRLAFFALSKCARAHLEPQPLSFASAPHRSPLGRVQLRLPGLFPRVLNHGFVAPCPRL